MHSNSNITQIVERQSFTSQLASYFLFCLNYKIFDVITVIICLEVFSFPYLLQTLLISNFSAYKPCLIFKRHFIFLNNFEEQQLCLWQSHHHFAEQEGDNFIFWQKGWWKREEVCSVEDKVVFLALSSQEKYRTPYTELESVKKKNWGDASEAELPFSLFTLLRLL